MIQKREQIIGWAAIIIGLAIFLEAAGAFLIKILFVCLALVLINYGLSILGKGNIKVMTFRVVDDLKDHFF